MPKVSIVEATRDDIPAILEIVNHYIVNDTCIYDLEPRKLETQLAWFDLQTENKNPIWVAKMNDNVVGFASFSQFRPKVGYRFTMEHSVYLNPNFQGLGIGKMLLLKIIESAQNNKIHTLIGGIDAANLNSIEFHKKMGFELVGRMNQVGYKFDRWLDLIWMQKTL